MPGPVESAEVERLVDEAADCFDRGDLHGALERAVEIAAVEAIGRLVDELLHLRALDRTGHVSIEVAAGRRLVNGRSGEQSGDPRRLPDPRRTARPRTGLRLTSLRARLC